MRCASIAIVSAEDQSGLQFTENSPLSLPQAVESELVSNLCGVHSVWQVLLVGKDEQEGVSELVLVEHTLQLLASLGNTLSVVRVDDEDNSLGVLEVCREMAEVMLSFKPLSTPYIQYAQLTVPPERSDLVLTTNIPYCERNVLVLDCLDVESDSWDGRDDFTELELVQDGCG